MFYSKSTNAFYDVEIHGNNMPNDVVSLTDEQYAFLFVGQKEGKQIVGGSDGFPVLIDRVDDRTYEKKRAGEYPDFRDYLDGVVKGDQAQIEAYITACQAVKVKYPKP